ncbi:hypothetical protein [Mesorhizobium sp. L2C084A000]|uniref:hypothetical protein n=1 Tax=unclassified Mesorhizobium TaxID=325217 RepID=UPI0003D02F1E|nr:hypothetical protein [Mesorhizobium sp. L2C084A000]ESZ20010.1 hypothetical protein X734_31655 [Mesorhizobium sp. L2C084A000]
MKIAQRLCRASIAGVVLVVISGCGPDETSDNDGFSLVNEEIYDVPAKTQIEQHVVAQGVPTKSELETEILKRFRAAKKRSGFRHHNSPTNIYIYVYGSEEQARAEQGLWIAMLAKNYHDTWEPPVLMDEGRLAALSKAPEDRFGLSEDVRKKVFKESVGAENRASREAMELIPDSRLTEQTNLGNGLIEKYKAEVVARYGITQEQLSKVQVEGITKGWLRQ